MHSKLLIYGATSILAKHRSFGHSPHFLIVCVMGLFWTERAGAEGSASEWLSNFNQQQKALAREVQKTRATMSERVMNPAFRLDLLRHEILRRVSPDQLRRFLRSAEEQKFLNEFLSSWEWMEPFVGSGPLENAGIAVLALTAITLDDPETNRSDLERRIALAVSLETALAKRTPENAVRVYQYYRDRARAGLLHPKFAGLAVWEMRFAVGARFTKEDLEYLGNRACFSVPESVHACWQVRYLDTNPFGDSIQCDKYYKPWSTSGLEYAECMVKIGGVCGSVSTTGVITCQASGIPAVTMGEPGHCAYAVRVRPGVWRDGNSVDGNHRSPHRYYYLANWSDLFAGDEAWQSPALLQAQGLEWAAHALPASEQAGRAELLDKALTLLPGHVGHWQERIELAKQMNVSPEWWAKAAGDLAKAFPKYPHLSWTLISTMPFNRLPRTSQQQIYSLWLTACGKAPADAVSLFPADQVVAALIAQRGKDDLKAFFIELVKEVKPTSNVGVKLVHGCREYVEREMRRCAEKEDKVGWNRIAEAGVCLVKANRYPHEHKPFPGEMLSKGGMLRVSSAYREDAPLTYPGIMDGRGGFLHTQDETNPSVTIELGRPGTLSGIVIVNRPGHLERAVPLKVSVSVDGKTWDEVFRAEKPEVGWRVDLRSSRPRARYVKVEGDYPLGRKDFLHLHGVFVYGQRMTR